jgi:hypothetical protein
MPGPGGNVRRVLQLVVDVSELVAWTSLVRVGFGEAKACVEWWTYIS